MAGHATYVVMWTSGLEGDGGSTAAVGGYGIASGTCGVVICVHFVHSVPRGIVEYCKHVIVHQSPEFMCMELLV